MIMCQYGQKVETETPRLGINNDWHPSKGWAHRAAQTDDWRIAAHSGAPKPA